MTTPATALSPSTSGLCTPFVVALFVDGASVTVTDAGGNQFTICATDEIAARAETLQFELGEGAHWEALMTGQPVLCPDLIRESSPAWPMFAEAARDLGIGAVFAFPMKIGAAVVGVVDLYCLTARRLDHHQISLAASMADRIAHTSMRRATSAAAESEAAEHLLAPALRREVHQATGMIQAQLDITATDAFARLRSYAFATGTPIEAVARAVVAGRTDFSTLSD